MNEEVNERLQKAITKESEKIEPTETVEESKIVTTKFELTGQTKKELQMGSFVKIQSRDGNEGTTCDSKWSCGKAIYNCLENDQDALISEGECAGVQYCVTCQDPQ